MHAVMTSAYLFSNCRRTAIAATFFVTPNDFPGPRGGRLRVVSCIMAVRIPSTHTHAPRRNTVASTTPGRGRERRERWMTNITPRTARYEGPPGTGRHVSVVCPTPPHAFRLADGTITWRDPDDGWTGGGPSGAEQQAQGGRGRG